MKTETRFLQMTSSTSLLKPKNDLKRQLSVLATVLFALPIASTAQTAEKTDTVSTKMMNLDEVTVRAMLVKHGKQSDEYRMIPKLTQGTTSVYDVLSRLPGIAYNDLTNTLSVRMDRNVLIEVDGKRVSQEYLQALTPERISRVEVVYAP